LCFVLAVVLGAGWWAVQEPSPKRRYERGTAPLIARLRKGEPIEIVRAGAPKPAFLLRCGEGITKARMTEEGVTVTTPGLGLGEFLPAVPLARFRVLAEFRHDPSRFGPVGDGGVGVTFSYRDASSPLGMHHVFGAVALNDWDRRNRGGSLKSRAMLQMVRYL